MEKDAAWPPRWGARSRTVTEAPARPRSRAATSPAMPPPTTATRTLRGYGHVTTSRGRVSYAPCGGSGIRTHGGPKTTTAFEAAPFVRSGIPPEPTLQGGCQSLPLEEPGQDVGAGVGPQALGHGQLVVEAGVDAE